jgi:hypothetical protein
MVLSEVGVITVYLLEISRSLSQPPPSIESVIVRVDDLAVVYIRPDAGSR